MKIRLVAFATASDAVGPTPRTIDLPDGSRLSDLAAALVAQHPTLAPIWDRLAVAVDGTMVRDDPALADGVEVALLPPVSGGTASVALTHEAIDVAAVERSVASPAYGAVVLFLGTVRDHHGGRDVARLDYSAYEAMAEARLAEIATDLERSGEVRVAIVHRLGSVPLGEASVVIATASAHRNAAYEANRSALERLKREVPIWKREHYADGSARWREEEPLGTAPAGATPAGVAG